MKANTIKNIRSRNSFFKNETEILIKKFMYVNFLNNTDLKKNLPFRYLLNKKNLISKVNFKNKCVLTGRNNAINNRLNLSRIQLRRMISFGVIPGYKKAVW